MAISSSSVSLFREIALNSMSVSLNWNLTALLKVTAVTVNVLYPSFNAVALSKTSPPPELVL